MRKKISSRALTRFLLSLLILSSLNIQINASNKSSESISTDTTEFRVLIKKLENLYYDSGAYQKVIGLSKQWQKNNKYQEDKKDEAYYWYRLFHLTGNGYISLVYYDSAIYNYKKSAKIALQNWGEDSTERAHNNIGLIFANTNQYDSAQKYFRKNIDLCLKQKNYEGLVGSYNNLALSYLDQNKPYRASLYLDLCLFYKKKYDLSYKDFNYYINKGKAESIAGNWNSALINDQKALKAAYSEFPKNHSEYSSILYNLTIDYINLKKYDSALIYNRKSVIIHKYNFSSIKHELYKNYKSYGKIYRLIGNIDSCIYYLTKANKYFKSNTSELKDQRGLASILHEKGQAYLDYFEYDSALHYFNLASDVVKHYDKKGININNELLYSLDGLSYTSYKHYRSCQNKKILVDGLNHYYSLIDRINSKDYSLWSEDDYSFRSEINNDFYGETLDLLYDLVYKFEEPNQFDSVLYVMEAYRGLLLRRSKDFSTSEHLKGELKAELEILKTKMERIDSDKLSESDSLEFLRLQEERLEVARKLDLLYEEVQEQYPRIYEKKSDFVSISSIQENLSDDEAVIEYLYTSETVYTLLIDQKSVSFKKVAFKIPNDSVIEPFAAYRSLVEPLELGSHIRKLIIIPDGPLWDINFELLVSEKTESDDPKKIPYLFKKYAISYAYAASLLFQGKIIERVKPEKPLLAFSFGESDNNPGNQISLRSMRSSSQELPGSRAEIRAIADLVDGDYFYGMLASEKKFREVASDYKILHLAVHGETDEDKPENSRLYFFSEGDSIEDGKLHAFELYNMQLDADLAVLTACNTGSGEIAEGEGVMSLGRAFAYAGVNSLLLTRHEISDAVAPELMKVFYRELKNGKRKSEALRQAKLEFLENANNINADPFYWGSFYILGNDDPIAFEDDMEYWKYIAGLLLLFSTVFFIIRWRKKSA